MAAPPVQEAWRMEHEGLLTDPIDVVVIDSVEHPTPD
jgi:hypothetical protein